MIGILGGTFDPIHFGHLRTALEVAESLALEQLRFLPSGQPPHRESPHARAEQRLAMVQAAIAGETRFVADDREIRREGPSFMVDSLRSLRQELGDKVSLGLIVGLDAFAALDTWHEWRRLIELAHLVVMTRPGWSLQDIRTPALEELVQGHNTQEVQDCHAAAAGRVIFCPVTQLNISSTDIRRQLEAGKDVRYLLPDTVLALIKQQHIYAR